MTQHMLPAAEISIEAGHFYSAAFAEGTAALTKRFEAIRPYNDIARASKIGSTVFLFDDYHNRPNAKHKPRDMIEQIQEASEAAGVPLDYIAREAACTRMAEEVLSLLKTTEPSPIRETSDQGWLIEPRGSRMRVAMQPYMPHRTQADKKGIIYNDIELYDIPSKAKAGQKVWSCPYLASIWQALRIGSLRDTAFDNPFAASSSPMPNWTHWEEVPPLMQLRSDAAPFVASACLSVLPVAFMEVEVAVGNILKALSGSPELAAPIDAPKQFSYCFTTTI